MSIGFRLNAVCFGITVLLGCGGGGAGGGPTGPVAGGFEVVDPN